MLWIYSLRKWTLQIPVILQCHYDSAIGWHHIYEVWRINSQLLLQKTVALRSKVINRGPSTHIQPSLHSFQARCIKQGLGFFLYVYIHIHVFCIYVYLHYIHIIYVPIYLYSFCSSWANTIQLLNYFKLTLLAELILQILINNRSINTNPLPSIDTTGVVLRYSWHFNLKYSQKV